MTKKAGKPDMAYQEPNEAESLLIEMNRLCGKVYALKNSVPEDIRKKIAETQDARIVFLDSIQVKLSVSIMVLSLCIDAKKKYSEANLRNVMKSPPSLDPRMSESEIVRRDEEAIIDHLVESLLSAVHFRMENFFYNVYKTLEETKQADPRPSFIMLFYDLFKRLEVEGGDIENAIIALTYIRNSFHNNGMHNKKKEFNAVIGGKEFSFIPGERIHCATWPGILVLIDTIVPFIEKLLNHPKIAKKDYIPDDFSFAYETTV